MHVISAIFLSNRSDPFTTECCEYRTVVSCTKQLETALLGLESATVHFLHQKGFITPEVHDEVLDPRSMWTKHQKVGELVTGIRNKVKLSAEGYHTLLRYLGQRGKYYEGIVRILETEYSKQQQPSKLSCH